MLWAVPFGVMVITVNMQELVWREKILGGYRRFFSFLPKPSLDRARTAELCRCKPPNRELGVSSGSRVQIPSRPPSKNCCLL